MQFVEIQLLYQCFKLLAVFLKRIIIKQKDKQVATKYVSHSSQKTSIQKKSVAPANKKQVQQPQTTAKPLLNEIKYQRKSRDEIYLTLQRFLLIFMRDSKKELSLFIPNIDRIVNNNMRKITQKLLLKTNRHFQPFFKIIKCMQVFLLPLIYNDDEKVAQKKYQSIQMIKGYKKVSLLMQVFIINHMYKYDKFKKQQHLDRILNKQDHHQKNITYDIILKSVKQQRKDLSMQSIFNTNSQNQETLSFNLNLSQNEKILQSNQNGIKNINSQQNLFKQLQHEEKSSNQQIQDNQQQLFDQSSQNQLKQPQSELNDDQEKQSQKSDYCNENFISNGHDIESVQSNPQNL